MGLHSRLFARLMSKNREVYALKVITLSIAFAANRFSICFHNKFIFNILYTDM
ncbi:MAG TPA: hypothetical protein VF490_12765 [Chryseosolibacter sp.]